MEDKRGNSICSKTDNHRKLLFKSRWIFPCVVGHFETDCIRGLLIDNFKYLLLRKECSLEVRRIEGALEGWISHSIILWISNSLRNNRIFSHKLSDYGQPLSKAWLYSCNGACAVPSLFSLSSRRSEIAIFWSILAISFKHSCMLMAHKRYCSPLAEHLK